MAPFVAIWGLSFNDVMFNGAVGRPEPDAAVPAAAPPAARGLSRRSEVDDLWLTALFGVGSVYYFCSVVGQVWFTAQIVAVTLSIGFVWASLGARRPMLAGLFVALGFATRPPWLVAPLFVIELVRSIGGWQVLRTRKGWRALTQAMVRFSLTDRDGRDHPGGPQRRAGSAIRSSSGTSSSRCSGRSGCFASACSTITSYPATSPPR